jgi:Flp pilus assembly protein TadG
MGGQMNTQFGVLRRFSREDRGAAMILFAVLIPVMMGIIGLVLDGGRFFIMNNEQQDLADAAASKLDGTQDGMDAAILAAQNLIAGIDPDGLTEGSDGAQIVEADIQFCTAGLGDNPWTPATCTVTVDPTLADFIEVRTIARTVSPVFTVAVGAVSDISTRAQAIAGTSIVACNVQPLMLCNPYESAGDEFSADVGQMFLFKQKGGGGSPAFVPGDFGLLDPPGQDSSTGPELRRLLSQQSPKFCYINNVSPRPGHNTGNVDTGINVRFDIQPSGAGQLTGMDLTPAPNVIKGFKPKNANNACGPQDDLGAVARMPRDTGLTQIGSTEVGTIRPSTAAKDAYWQYHHGANWPAGVATRYDAYKMEIAMATGGTWGRNPAPEPSNPSCAPAGVRNAGDETRRVISVTVVDCLAAGVQGNATTNVRANKYAEFFVTEPAAGGIIFAEFIRLLEAGEDDGKLRRIVQLYR